MTAPSFSALPLQHAADGPIASARSPESARDGDLRAAAEGFEALFLNQVLKSARAASFGGALGDSSGLETTQSMLDMQLSDIGANRAGLGLAEAVYRQFSGQGRGT